MSKKNQKKIYIIIIVIIVYLYGSVLNIDLNEAYSNLLTSDLKIFYFDVGQADSIFISNNNYNMLIDGGNNEDGPKLVKFIKDKLNVSKIDYIVGTHPHEDHIGGLDDIINNFEIGKIMIPNAITPSKTFEDMIAAIESKKLSITIPKEGESFFLGNAKFEVLHTGTDTIDLNNSSIVLKMVFGDHSYLFTGDATREIEYKILEKDIDIDILKVAHHGSADSSIKDFLKKATPKYAIISVGKDNSYGHPAKSTINRLKKYTDNIYLTSKSGTIVLISDGKQIDIRTIKLDTNG